MTRNDRKRPQDLPSFLPLRGMDSSEIPRFSVHFPRKFHDFPRNSLIFSDFLDTPLSYLQQLIFKGFMFLTNWVPLMVSGLTG